MTACADVGGTPPLGLLAVLRWRRLEARLLMVCLWLILRRPNARSMPDAVERTVRNLPRAIHGWASANAEHPL